MARLAVETCKLELFDEAHHAKFYFDPTIGMVSANTSKVSFFVVIGRFVACSGHTERQILTTYASRDVFLPKDVPFGGHIDTCIPFSIGQIPQSPKGAGE